MEDYDMSIHRNPDARAWAQFFLKRNPDCGLDEGAMIGWFANAMMAMHDYLLQPGPMNGDEAQYWIDKAKEAPQ